MKKIILMSLMIILGNNFRAEAQLTSTWDGDINDVPNGWEINNILIQGLLSESFHAGDGNATGNNLTINATGNTISQYIIGGWSTTGNADYNTVNITAGTFTGNFIYGGYSDSDATGNTVNIFDGSFVNAAFYGGQAVNGNADYNIVNIFDGSFAANIIGGLSLNANAIGNIVNIFGGDFAGGNIIGGSVVSGNADYNIVNISGGTFDVGVGGNGAKIYGGNSINGTTTGNTVNITAGTFTDAKIYGGESVDGTAINNIVNINGGDFTGANTTIAGGSSINGTTTGNIVNITGGNFTGATSIFGGFSTTSTGDLRTGNKLILHVPMTVKDVGNFEYYEFHTADINTAMLTTTGTIDFGTDAHILINITDTSEIINIGSEIKLLDYTTGAGTGNVGSAYAVQGMSLLHNLTENSDLINKIYGMTVTSTKLNPQSTAFPNARLASFSFMNQASDLIFGQGIASAINSVTVNPEQWAFFGLVSGVYSGYDNAIDDTTGNTTFGGPSLMVGGAKDIPIKVGSLLVGGYFETGFGFIESDIDTIVGTVATEGNANYYGAGFLAHYKMDNGFYTEGFLRLGVLDDNMNFQNTATAFEHDSLSMYTGAGLNFGYELQLFNARDFLDFYTGYAWGHLMGSEQKLDGQNYKFDAINSHQVSFGTTYNFIQNSMFSPYLGIGGKYEFAGKSVATIREKFETLSPNTIGITGTADIGVRITPSETLPLTMALNLGGHIGKMEGFDVSFDIEYLF